MLGLGWTEMLVIGVAALIFVGPKDLPVVMSRAGKIIGQIRRMGNEFQREINKTTGLDEVRNLRNSITAPLKKTTDEIRKEFNAMTPTGVQPSGVIKPANPKAESVVDEIRAAAGMPIAAASVPIASAGEAVVAPKTNDEIAAEAGFKPSAKPETDKPVAVAKTAAAKKAPVKATPAPTRPVITTDLKPIEAAAPVAEAPVKAAVAKKPAAKKPTAADSAKPAAAKRPAAKKAPAAAKPAEAGAKPAKKPAAQRAPAAKAPINTDAAKAGDE